MRHWFKIRKNKYILRIMEYILCIYLSHDSNIPDTSRQHGAKSLWLILKHSASQLLVEINRSSFVHSLFGWFSKLRPRVLVSWHRLGTDLLHQPPVTKISHWPFIWPWPRVINPFLCNHQTGTLLFGRDLQNGMISIWLSFSFNSLKPGDIFKTSYSNVFSSLVWEHT